MESLEQQYEGGQQGGAAEGDQTQSMSLLGGVARPEGLPEADASGIENADGSGAGRAISQGTVLVIVVAVIAAGSIYAMRLTQGKIANERGAQVEAKMEQILAKLTNPAAISSDDPLHPDTMKALFQDTDKIVGMLETDTDGQQVPVEYVKKNPFELPIQKEADTPTQNVSDRNRERQLKRLQGELKRFSLQTVMNGASGPIAVIDGEFYKKGKTLGSFRIANIDASALTVTLSAAGKSFKLTMND